MKTSLDKCFINSTDLKYYDSVFYLQYKKNIQKCSGFVFCLQISVDFEISSLLSSIPPCFGSILDAFPLCIRLSWDKIITRYQWQSTRVNIRNIRDFIDDIREVYSVPFYIKIVIHIHVWMKTGNLQKKMEEDPHPPNSLPGLFFFVVVD